MVAIEQQQRASLRSNKLHKKGCKMPDLTQKTDEQLKFMFSITASPWEADADTQAIIDELRSRGYIFDARHRDFLTCEEWNRRNGDWSPMDCTKPKEA